MAAVVSILIDEMHMFALPKAQFERLNSTYAKMVRVLAQGATCTKDEGPTPVASPSLQQDWPLGTSDSGLKYRKMRNIDAVRHTQSPSLHVLLLVARLGFFAVYVGCHGKS